MPQRLSQYIVNQKHDESSYRHPAAHLADEFRQTFQLQVQRGLYTRDFRCLTCHVAYLRLVTNSRHHIASRTVHHHRRTQQLVAGICRDLLRVQRLRRQHLSRQTALVHLQISSLKQLSVGRHFVARLDNYDVTHHNLTTWYFHDVPFAHHLHSLFLAQLRQHVELPCCVALKIEANSCSQNHRSNNTYGFNIVVFHERQHQRYHSGHQQDAHHWVLVFLQIQAPHRLSTWWSQHVLAMLQPTYRHLSGTQSLFLITHSVGKGTIK